MILGIFNLNDSFDKIVFVFSSFRYNTTKRRASLAYYSTHITLNGNTDEGEGDDGYISVSPPEDRLPDLPSLPASYTTHVPTVPDSPSEDIRDTNDGGGEYNTGHLIIDPPGYRPLGQPSVPATYTTIPDSEGTVNVRNGEKGNSHAYQSLDPASVGESSSGHYQGLYAVTI